MAEPRTPELVELIMQLSDGLGDVEPARAHGCEGVAARGRAYALAASGGRVAVRLPDWDLFTLAFELPGSEPLMAEGHRVGHWVVLPGAIRDDGDALGEWVRRAHELTAVDV